MLNSNPLPRYYKQLHVGPVLGCLLACRWRTASRCRTSWGLGFLDPTSDQGQVASTLLANRPGCLQQLNQLTHHQALGCIN